MGGEVVRSSRHDRGRGTGLTSSSLRYGERSQLRDPAWFLFHTPVLGLVGVAEGRTRGTLPIAPRWDDCRLLDGLARNRAEGFQRLDLGATLPGVAFYRAFGFREIKRFVVTMPDGVTLDAIEMERPVDPL